MEDEPKIVASFVTWLYTKIVTEISFVDDLVTLYFFADKIQSIGFKNYSMDVFQDYMWYKETFPTDDMIIHIFENTSGGGLNEPIRKTFCALIAHDVATGTWIEADDRRGVVLLLKRNDDLLMDYLEFHSVENNTGDFGMKKTADP